MAVLDKIHLMHSYFVSFVAQYCRDYHKNLSHNVIVCFYFGKANKNTTYLDMYRVIFTEI